MTIERVTGFVMTQDRVHGVPTWKVRIKQTGHEHNGRKCRVVSTHQGYDPCQSDAVSFVIGSTVEKEQTILLAYDVAPIVENKKPKLAKPSRSGDTMNWVVTQTSDGEVHAAHLGVDSLEEAQHEIEGSGEKILTFIPFDIAEHVGEWDDPEVVNAFEMVRAMRCTPATMQALEKLATALVRAVVKAKT